MWTQVIWKYFTKKIFSSKILCGLPSILCLSGKLWPLRFIWHHDLRVDHCQSSATSFELKQYSFCNSFRTLVLLNFWDFTSTEYCCTIKVFQFDLTHKYFLWVPGENTRVFGLQKGGSASVMSTTIGAVFHSQEARNDYKSVSYWDISRW